MDDQIAKIIKKHYPEIAQGWHVPVWAVVTTINEDPKEGDLSNQFRPRYAVNVKLLDKQGNEASSPEMPNIAISGNFSASGGIMQPPEPGAIVELNFAFGDINKPYISTVLPYNSTLPSCKPGKVVTQGRKGAKTAIDNNGNISLETDRELKQISTKLTQLANQIKTEATSKTSTTRSHLIENVGGKYQLTAFGALLLLTTGHAELSALESLTLSTASDLNENVAGKKQVIAGELISMLVEEGGKINIGNSGVNVVDILYQLIDVVNQLATSLSTHIHPAPDGTTSAPTNASEIGGQASQANALAEKLKPLV